MPAIFIPLVYRITPDSNPTVEGPNILGGFNGNVIDPTCQTCAILSGGQSTHENMILDAFGDGSQTNWSVITGGYHNTISNGWPSVIGGGAHNRINTPILEADTGFDQGTAGTGTISSSAKIVTGVGTAFTTFFKVGSAIIVGAQIRYVESIASATSLTTKTAFSPTLSGATYKRSNWLLPNVDYVTALTTNHCAILSGTYNQLGNAGFSTIAGGTQNTIGYDGTSQTQSDNCTIGGGSQNIVTGTAGTVSGGQKNVVTGSWSTIVGGTGNTITDNSSVCGGESNLINGQYCTVFGFGNQATFTGINATTLCGYQNTSNQNYGAAFGRQINIAQAYSYAMGRASRSNKQGQFSLAGGSFTSQGDAQQSFLSVSCRTTDATQTEMGCGGAISGGGTFGSGGTISSADRLLVSSTGGGYATVYADIMVIAQKQTSTDFARWRFSVVIQRQTNAASIAIAGGDVANTAPDASSGTGSAWRIAIQADTTNNCWKVLATGAAATNIQWEAAIRLSEVAYA